MGAALGRWCRWEQDHLGVGGLVGAVDKPFSWEELLIDSAVRRFESSHPPRSRSVARFGPKNVMNSRRRSGRDVRSHAPAQNRATAFPHTAPTSGV